jgi:4-amino-4-deoxy-L-arabinose transferase-like glycosyltransferase
MIVSLSPKFYSRAALFGVLFVAVVLRWQYFLQIEHNVDHAHSVWQALRTLHYGDLPIIGLQSSVLVPHPALMGYLFIPLIGLTRSIIAVYMAIIALNTLAVFITYRALKPMISTNGALIAAALMAVTPWTIEYSRLSWHPGLMPFCVSLFFWAFTSVLLKTAKHPARRLFLALLLLTVMSQMVLISYFLLLPVGILALLFWRRINWRIFIIGMGIFALVTLIYIGSLVIHQQAYSGRVTQFVENTATAQLKPDALQHALRLVSGRDYEIARGTQAPIQDSVLRHDITGNIAAPIVEILLGFGAILALRGVISQRQAKTKPSALWSLLIWFFVPIAAMSYNASPVHPYYVLVTLPAGYGLAAYSIVWLLRSRLRFMGIGLLLLFFPFGILMSINSTRYYQETAHIPGAHQLGALSLEWGLHLGQAINQKLPEGGSVFADVDEYILNSFAAQPFPVFRNTTAPAATRIPAAGGLYIVAYPPDTEAIVPPFAERVATLNLPDETFITIDRFAPFNGDRPLPENSTSYAVSGETWLMLRGYHIEQRNADITLDTYWQVTAPTDAIADTAFTPTLHLFNAAGERVAIVDGVAIPTMQWRVGDVLVQRFAFTLPEAGSYSVRVGQYDGVKPMGLIFILPDGQYTDLIPLPELLNQE